MSKRNIKTRRRHRVFPHQLSWLIDNPLRKLLVSPKRLVDRLSLSSSSRVLELGPGSGFFSVELAARLTDGHLDLFDLQPRMLEKAERKLRAHGFSNVTFTVGNAGDALPYPENHFDLVLLVSVLGEVSDQDHCIESLHRLLRPAGMVVFHESIPDPDMIGLDKLKLLVERHGFQLSRHWGRRWNYTGAF